MRCRLSVWFAFLAFGLTALLSVSVARAGEPDGDDDISVLTMGPGDHPFTKFGHTALLVENRAARTKRVYNYGAFSFDSLWLIPRFLAGKYRYWLAVDDYQRTLAHYAAANRSITMQRLRLSAAETRQIVDFLEQNAREENKYYVFDYYRDNCSTRIRDVLDRALGGAAFAAARGPAGLTWRGHTQRLTAGDLPVYSGLYAAMGNVIDQPITRWEEMFLPEVLEEQLRRTVRGGSLAGPLVAEEIELVRANRPAPLGQPPRWAPWLAAVGTAIAGAVMLLGRLAAQRVAVARALLGGWLALFGLLTGLLGCCFLLLWIFTNHDVAHHNENLLQCLPLGLFMVGPGIRSAFGRPLGRWMRRVCAFAAACSLAGLMLKVLPWFNQENGQMIALFLPLWLGSAWAVRRRVESYGRAPERDARTADSAVPPAGARLS